MAKFCTYSMTTFYKFFDNSFKIKKSSNKFTSKLVAGLRFYIFFIYRGQISMAINIIRNLCTNITRVFFKESFYLQLAYYMDRSNSN